MDDQIKDHIDLEGPTQGNRPKQLQTHILPSDDVKNINSTNKRRELLPLPWRQLFPEEQKGCRKGSRGTGELLYIYQHILNESKTRRKNLAMAWIDYKKAYDVILHSWIINCLKMYKISDEVINFIEKTMRTWSMELTAGGKSLAKTKVQRDIFQGDALSPLLFIIAMMPLNNILRKCTAGYKLNKSQEKIYHLMYMDDIKLFAKNEKELETLTQLEYTVRTQGMEFGIEKCAMLVMKSGKRHLTTGMKLLNQDKIKTLGEKETYKYLGILEANTIKQVEMKEKIKENQKATQDKTIQQKPYQRNKYPWCNGYRRKKWTRRNEFKSWTRLIAFNIALTPLRKVWIQLFPLQLWVNSRTDWVLQPWWGN